jgi:hypothetical protein
MNHPNEEQLVLYYYGESDGAEGVEAHLSGCERCRESYQSLQRVLNTVDALAIPERPADYGTQVWRRIESRTGARRRRGWLGMWQIWVWTPVMALLLMLAFLTGRYWPGADKTPPVAKSQVRERILLVAVGDHLERSQMVLAELSHAPDGKGRVDISQEQKTAADLLETNRLYRQTANSTGNTAVASVLDDLERVLVEIANSPPEVSSHRLEELQQRIREEGLLFKVRVIGTQVRQSVPSRDRKGVVVE